MPDRTAEHSGGPHCRDAQLPDRPQAHPRRVPVDVDHPHGRLAAHVRSDKQHTPAEGFNPGDCRGGFGLIQISDSDPIVMWIAGLTVTLTAINITGGFAVTQRMLAMFRK